MQLKIEGYQLLEKLGVGANGAVFKAKQISMDRTVAIKILKPDLAKDIDVQKQFLAEARASAKLAHRNIIQGIDVGKTPENLFYFVMEFVDGPTGLDNIKAQKCIPQEEVISIITQICKALDHAHKHNFVHRDVKPENIMITKKNIAKLCDLGLAVRKKDASGVPVGTPFYMSPEQIEGVKELDIRSDIYSLGATAFHMATGKVPFGGAPTIVMSKHLTKPIPHPKKVHPPLSDSFCQIILKMLAKKVEDRYQTPKDVITAFEELEEEYEEEEESSSSSIQESSKKQETRRQELQKLGDKLKRKFPRKKRRF